MNFAWAALAAWTTCVLGGCATGDDLPPEQVEQAFFVDPAEWTDQELTQIYSAAARWNTLAGHELVRIELLDGEQSVRHIRKSSLPEHNVGMHNPRLDNIRIDVAQAGGTFETVLVHELGHALGMAHIDERGIMFPVVDGSVRDFTQGDREECLRVRVCLDRRTAQ